jgi:hypothetical protein
MLCSQIGFTGGALECTVTASEGLKKFSDLHGLRSETMISGDCFRDKDVD